MISLPQETSEDLKFQADEFQKPNSWGTVAHIYIALSFFHCSQVRGSYPAFSSASLPPLKQGQTCVAATSTTIWPRFIKQLQIYLNMRTSSGGGHKNVSHFLGGCSVLCAHTNGAEHAHTRTHAHTMYCIHKSMCRRTRLLSSSKVFVYLFLQDVLSVQTGERKKWGA